MGYGQLPPGLQRVQHGFHSITVCTSHHTPHITKTTRRQTTWNLCFRLEFAVWVGIREFHLIAGGNRVKQLEIAACGTGKSRWNAVVCVESGVRLWGAAFRFGMRRSCVEFSEKARNSAQKVEFSESAWNSAQKVEFGRSTLEFEFHIGIPGFTVEFSQKARNSRSSVESAGVVLVMWGVRRGETFRLFRFRELAGRGCSTSEPHHCTRLSGEKR